MTRPRWTNCSEATCPDCSPGLFDQMESAEEEIEKRP